MTLDLTQLTKEQLASLKGEIEIQMKSANNTFVASILARSADKGDLLEESKNGNPTIKHYVNATNTEGTRIFGTLYIQNKKNPSVLEELTAQ
tara:strand:+ start:289 stop:564 length:276 start_codon:yes stop_codon:yes gene_type:complete